MVGGRGRAQEVTPPDLRLCGRQCLSEGLAEGVEGNVCLSRTSCGSSLPSGQTVFILPPADMHRRRQAPALPPLLTDLSSVSRGKENSSGARMEHMKVLSPTFPSSAPGSFGM
jgi:hypothetical protein